MADALGLYLNDIGKIPLIDAEQEREYSRLIERGQNISKLYETAQKLGPQAIQEARVFIADVDSEEINDDDVEAKEASPYFTLLRSLVEVESNPRLVRTEIHKGAVAKDQFIRANLRLVVSIARRYPLPQGMELLDLIQEGNLGLEHAADKFDWRRGFKFSTYATFWIRQSIGRALDQKASLIRLPGDRSSRLRAALREAGQDASKLDQNFSDLNKLTSPVSLDKSIGEDNDATIGDVIPSRHLTPEEDYMSIVQSELIDELLSTLDPRARFAVEARFGLVDGEKKSYREIGQNLGVTAEAARRIIGRSIPGLRSSAENIFELSAAYE
jgi:RNA polymerase sigma factor (sigma-70 family)